ncbi:MAG: hypothetical protein HQL54_12415 [Magnetococcales bacterium]|nr:hypothetical protein [Magnetococcales bacterium]
MIWFLTGSLLILLLSSLYQLRPLTLVEDEPLPATRARRTLFSAQELTLIESVEKAAGQTWRLLIDIPLTRILEPKDHPPTPESIRAIQHAVQGKRTPLTLVHRTNGDLICIDPSPDEDDPGIPFSSSRLVMSDSVREMLHNAALPVISISPDQFHAPDIIHKKVQRIIRVIDPDSNDQTENAERPTPKRKAKKSKNDRREGDGQPTAGKPNEKRQTKQGGLENAITIPANNLQKKRIEVRKKPAPSCPRCSNPMRLRKLTAGKQAGRSIWLCRDYPRCKTALTPRATAKQATAKRPKS